MQSLLFTNNPEVSGNAYGFWELYANGLRTIGHGGDTIWFHSQLVLIPEKMKVFLSPTIVLAGADLSVKICSVSSNNWIRSFMNRAASSPSITL